MNTNTPNPGSGQYNGNSMIDMLRTQMMTMTMFSSMNGNKNSGGDGRGSTATDGLYGLLYIFLITQFIEFICKNAPVWIAFIVNYYKDKIKASKLANSFSDKINNTIQTKSSSIIVKLSINDADNIIGNVLDSNNVIVSSNNVIDNVIESSNNVIESSDNMNYNKYQSWDGSDNDMNYDKYPSWDGSKKTNKNEVNDIEKYFPTRDLSKYKNY